MGKLPAVTAPAFDGSVDDPRFIPGLAPQAGEARVGRRRPLLRLEVVEADPDRDGDAFAADNAFAVAKRRDRIEEATRAFRHRRAHAGLVAVVVETHRDDRAALREHAFGKVRRTLRDQAEADAILTAFLGDTLQYLADRLSILLMLVLGHVAVSLLADEQYRLLRFGP